jgi:nitrilase
MHRVGVIQLTTSSHLSQNLEALKPWFIEAAENNVKLLVLPENFAFMGLHEQDKFAIAEKEGQGVVQQTIRTLAKKFGIWVIAGTLPLKSKGHDSRVRASSLVFDDRGECIACYDKIHLFDVHVPGGESHRESSTIQPGECVVVVDTPVGRVGLSVCYDLRFPELYRQLTLKGAQLFTVASAFTATTGLAHWEVLLRARAVENLCYVLAPNQGGHHENGRKTYGHSMIINPWGEILAETNDQPGLVIAEIDLSYQHTLRQHFPCNEHHKMVQTYDNSPPSC